MGRTVDELIEEMPDDEMIDRQALYNLRAPKHKAPAPKTSGTKGRPRVGRRRKRG